MLKNMPVRQETWVWSPGQENPLEKGMATHSSIITWRIPWTEEPGAPQSMGSQRACQDRATHFHFLSCWSRFSLCPMPIFRRVVVVVVVVLILNGCWILQIKMETERKKAKLVPWHPLMGLPPLSTPGNTVSLGPFSISGVTLWDRTETQWSRF